MINRRDFFIKDVLLKPNFNTADPFPGSTHNDTLTYLILHLKEMGARSITIGERSGPPETSSVLRKNMSLKLSVGITHKWLRRQEKTPEGVE